MSTHLIVTQCNHLCLPLPLQPNKVPLPKNIHTLWVSFSLELRDTEETNCFIFIVKPLFTWAIFYIGEEVRTPDKSRGFNSHRIVREELKSGEEYAITINGYRDGGFESSLQIHNLQPHHFTKYYCEAQNSKGDDGLVIHLLKGSQQQKRKTHVFNAGNSSNNLDKYSSLTLLAQLIIILVCTN